MPSSRADWLGNSLLPVLKSTAANGVSDIDSVFQNGLPAAAVQYIGGHRFTLLGQAPSLSSEGQCIWLSGRIFNAAVLAGRLHLELPDESAVLLHAYRAWGTECVDHLDGEFAFALWDSHTGRLLLGRDPSGYWPLFYSQIGDQFVFAGELRRVLEWPGVTTRLNEERIAQWLGLCVEPTDKTFFENVFTVRPGSTLLFEQGRIERRGFWHPEKTPMLRLRDSREYADGLLEVLDRAVGNRLPAHGPVGTQLSGGLDSSSVTATAAQLLSKEERRVFAFTAVPEHAVDVPGRFSDEGPHATALAAMYPNVNHVLVRHGNHPVLSMIDRFGAAQGEPVFNPGNYDWLYGICVQASQRQLTTLLIAFAGNNTISYHGGRLLSSLVREGRFLTFARLAHNMVRQGTRRWRGVVNELTRPFLPFAVRYAIDKARGRASATLEYSLIRPDFSRRHGIGLMALEQSVSNLDDRALRLFLLRRQDLGPVMSAFRQLTGVSMSDPTYDRRLIEYCLSIPLEYFCENGVPRSLIRTAMAARLPDKIRIERRRGAQAADIGIHFERERQEALAELGRIKKVDLAAQALNLEAMESALQWPPTRIKEFGEALYWARLLRALSLGRFLRRLEDGTLFSQNG